MSIFSKIAGFLGGSVSETTKQISDVVERWVPSDKAQHDMKIEGDKLLNDSVASARQYDPKTIGTTSYSEIVNATIDGINRLIRPSMTILIMGAVFGWWPVQTRTLDPIILSWAEAIGAFWFGMRSITRDIPSLIKMLVDIKRGK